MDSQYFIGFFLLFINVALVSAEINGSVLKMKRGTSSVQFDPTRVTQLSRHPRAFIYEGFLSNEECDHLIILAKDKLEKSMVVDNESGQSTESEVRTSSGMFLDIAQDKVVADIEERISTWTFLPVENGESLQILHYEYGQKYEPHFDYFYDKVNLELAGHRIATVLMYLSDVESGGETVFPNSEGKLSQSKDESWSDCAKRGYAVKPRKGDALLFFSLHPNATTDPSSLHGSCPVIRGEKWSATKWIHVQSFANSGSQTGDCVDENENCPAWAIAGECERNPIYMVGSEEYYGYCRKSCKETTALKVAYADVMLNMAKESASRVIVSEKRASLFQHQLDCSNKESLRLLLRLKHMIDVKQSQMLASFQTIEAETTSMNQKRKINELESQLNEAEDVITDLRVELNHVRDKLKRAKRTQAKPPLSGETTCEDATSLTKPTVRSPLKPLTVAESEMRNNVLNHGYLHRCCNAAKQGDWPKSCYPHNSGLATIVVASEKPKLYRNGCTQGICALARNLETKHTNNGTKRCGDLEEKLQHKSSSRENGLKTGKSEIKIKPLTRLGPGSTLITCKVEPSLNASNESSTMVDKSNGRLLKYSFHIRKRKKESLGNLNEKISEENTLKRKAGDEEKENSLQEISNPNLVNQYYRESQQLAQVARQLISLSGKRWQ
ncbi:hypothetical protein V6N11_014721 [Hibiscus sabdariffa]|uniref:procollagen-proline 4-dioxygenase n=1 Tax=Hibiscus sabdariffa TaxID=183260 RepID=A0ABR2TPW8_9ROSI